VDERNNGKTLFEISISCIKYSYLDLATPAQAYLEILRIWTRNNAPDKHLLFREVGSAGVYLSTELTQKHPSKDAKATKLLASNKVSIDSVNLRALHAALQENQNAEETECIMARTAYRTIQGFTQDHLLRWDYIICFDSKVEAELNRLYKAVENEAITTPGAAKVKAKIMGRLDIKYDKNNLKGSATELMRVLEKWVQENFKHNGKKWAAPNKPMNGTWRTKQIVIPGAQYRALWKVTATKSEWEDVQKKTKCDLKATSEREDGTRLVTITGDKKEDLQKAAERLEKFWV